MIVNEADRNFQTDSDIYTLAGRLALVGGGTFAAMKTFEQASSLPETIYSKRSSKFKTDLAEIMRRSGSATQRIKEDFPTTTSSFFKNPIERKPLKYLEASSFSRIKNNFSGGYKGYSAGLGDEIQGLIDNLEKRGMSPLLKYQLGDSGHINYLQIDAGQHRFSINPVDENSFAYTGMNQQNRYVSRPVYRAEGLKPITYGEDVATIRAYNRNLDDIISGELSVNEIHEAMSSARNYDDKNFQKPVTSNSNPDLIGYMRESMIEDPSLNVNPNDLRGMSPEYKERFMIEQGKRGLASSSPSDVNRGVLLGNQNPLSLIPFLDETANPKQIFRNVEFKDRFGQSSYVFESDTLFMDKESMDIYSELQRKRGTSFGELADEQVIARDGFGTIIDRQKSITLASNSIGASGEGILKEAARRVGLDPSEFSRVIEESGLSAFSPEQQASIRQIDLGINHRRLKEELDSERRKRIDLKREERAWNRETSLVEKSPREDLIKAIQESDSRIERLRGELSTANFFGNQPDGMRSVFLDKTDLDLMLDDIHFSDGKITLRTRREKSIGAGDKKFDPSGEAKVVVKGTTSSLTEDLAEVHRIRTGQLATDAELAAFGKVSFIAPESAMKTRLEGRNLATAFRAAELEAERRSDAKLLHELKSFRSNYKNIEEAQRIQIFKKIEELTGQDALSYSVRKTSIGKVRTHFAAWGSTAIDMGAGNLAGFSERHLYNMKTLGLTNFIQDITSRRMNPAAVSAAVTFSSAKRALDSNKIGNSVNLKDINSGVIDSLFPIITNDPELAMKERAAITKLLTGKDNQTVFIDLGESINGNRYIPIFSQDIFRGYTGAQIGSAGDIKSYTELDKATRAVLREAIKPKRDLEKLNTLIKNHSIALEQMENSLRRGFLKDKVSNSLLGVMNSAPDGLQNYSNFLKNTYGTKQSLNAVATVSKEDFISMFGQDAYKNIHTQFAENFGSKKINKDTDFSGKKFKSSFWAMLTRDPSEGYSSIPTNILPDDIFEGGNRMRGAISVISKDSSDSYGLLKAIFGDFDGDQGQLLAANTKAASMELEELAFGNSERSLAYRTAQRTKQEISLKGADKTDGINVYDIPLEERREGLVRAKQLEKSMIGKISNRLQDVHQSIHVSMGNNQIDFTSASRAINSLNFFAESSIKAKHQTNRMLRAQYTKKSLEMLTGEGTAALLSLEDRKKNFMSYYERIFLGEDAGDLAERIRSSNVIDGDLMRDLQARGIEDSKKAVSWFKEIANQENIDNIFSHYEQGKLMNTSGAKISIAQDLMDLAEDATDSEAFNQKLKTEGMIGTKRKAGDLLLKGAENFGKFALLPMAAIGLAGTLSGSSSEIKAEKTYSDGQRNHSKTSYEQRPIMSPNMNRPKYNETSISGTSNNNSFNPNMAPQNTSFRLRDERGAFDKYRLQDTIDRDY